MLVTGISLNGRPSWIWPNIMTIKIIYGTRNPYIDWLLGRQASRQSDSTLREPGRRTNWIYVEQGYKFTFRSNTNRARVIIKWNAMEVSRNRCNHRNSICLMEVLREGVGLAGNYYFSKLGCGTEAVMKSLTIRQRSRLKSGIEVGLVNDDNTQFSNQVNKLLMRFTESEGRGCFPDSICRKKVAGTTIFHFIFHGTLFSGL